MTRRLTERCCQSSRSSSAVNPYAAVGGWALGTMSDNPRFSEEIRAARRCEDPVMARALVLSLMVALAFGGCGVDGRQAPFDAAQSVLRASLASDYRRICALAIEELCPPSDRSGQLQWRRNAIFEAPLPHSIRETLNVYRAATQRQTFYLSAGCSTSSRPSAAGCWRRSYRMNQAATAASSQSQLVVTAGIRPPIRLKGSRSDQGHAPGIRFCGCTSCRSSLPYSRLVS